MESSIKPERLLELAKKYGTPLYVYDGDLVEKRYEELYEFFPWPSLKIYYAMKANYNFHILQLLNDMHAYVDAVSLGDVIMAMRAGFESEDILFTANDVTIDEIRKVKERDILVNIEALSTLEKYGEAFEGSDVCIRFNPDVAVGEHRHVVTGGDESKFGILMSDLPKVQEIVDTYNLRVVGLHEHLGSGISDTDKVYESMEKLLHMATRESFPHLKFIDFGGGFKVPYRPDEKRIDYKSFGARVVRLFEDFCRGYSRELELYFEPGKYIVAEAGYLLIEVNTLKHQRNRSIAGTNSGFSQLIRPILYDAYHHILNLSNPGGQAKTYDIYGNICESGDYFARDRTLPEVREGDILALLNAGAYCYSMGSVYNLRPMPAEVIVKKGKDRLSRKGLSSDELVGKIVYEHTEG
jgi:diaminopimelate decarboxylase